MQIYRKTNHGKKAKFYTIDMVDHRGVRQRFPGVADQDLSNSMGVSIQKLIRCKGVETPDQTTLYWVSVMPVRLRNRLIEVGLLDAKRAGQTLEDYITEYEDPSAHPKVKKADSTQVSMQANRLRRICTGCGFKGWMDVVLHADKVDSWLREQEDFTANTRGCYIKVFRWFCAWMIEKGYADSMPKGLTKSREVDVQPYAAMEESEYLLLLETTAKAGESYGLSGPARAILYRLAFDTGLRRGELAALRVRDVNIKQRTVTVAGIDCKDSIKAVQTITEGTAAILKDYIKGKTPDVRLFDRKTLRRRSSKTLDTAALSDTKTADMLRDDLDAARKAWIDDAKEPDLRQEREQSEFLQAEGERGKIVFHSLRHTCASSLAAKGVHPSVAQSILRHKDVNLTMSRYTHVLHESQVQAINSLGEVYTVNQQVRTGTDETAENVGQNVGHNVGQTGDDCGHKRKPRLGFQAKNAVSNEGEGARTLNLRIDSPMTISHKDMQDKDLRDDPKTCGTKCGTVDDPRLMKIMAAWNRLDEAMKQVMMKLIQ
jgi:integrase